MPAPAIIFSATTSSRRHTILRRLFDGVNHRGRRVAHQGLTGTLTLTNAHTYCAARDHAGTPRSRIDQSLGTGDVAISAQLCVLSRPRAATITLANTNHCHGAIASRRRNRHYPLFGGRRSPFGTAVSVTTFGLHDRQGIVSCDAAPGSPDILRRLSSRAEAEGRQAAETSVLAGLQLPRPRECPALTLDLTNSFFPGIRPGGAGSLVIGADSFSGRYRARDRRHPGTAIEFSGVSAAPAA